MCAFDKKKIRDVHLENLSLPFSLTRVCCLNIIFILFMLIQLRITHDHKKKCWVYKREREGHIYDWKEMTKFHSMDNHEKKRENSFLVIWIKRRKKGSSRGTKWMRHSLSFFISFNHAYTNWWIMISFSMCEILFYPFRTYYNPHWTRSRRRRRRRGRRRKYKKYYDTMYK